MNASSKKNNPTWLKRILLAGIVLLVAGAAVVWYLFTLKYEDTAGVKADYTVEANDLLREFTSNDSLANAKYTEKILVVSGIVSEVESVDTTVNLKFSDTATGAYAIFAFQAQHAAAAKNVKAGDKVSIKGSCSGGAYSTILETAYINFKRCALEP